MEGHNTWIANHEGSTFVIPVGDLAQHVLATICYFTQNGYTIYDMKKMMTLQKGQYLAQKSLGI